MDYDKKFGIPENGSTKKQVETQLAMEIIK